MGKSNYPNKLDTSVEIPVIRDNITEIGSDVLNSFRSAIFNIERALGINPQGAVGNTVASRLNSALDDNGNIKKEALDRANVLAGPVSDEDISKVAGISESKLKLDFPTHLLQDQISIIDNRISLFIKSLEELNALLSSHVHPDAKNRHKAKAITVDSAVAASSGVASVTLQDGTLQEVLEELYNAHINYTGEGVGSENNSHSASQIYYDNLLTSDIIDAPSVQGAIDDIAAVQGKSLRSALLSLHSNGIIRTGVVKDHFEANDAGSIIVGASEISFSEPGGDSRVLISFPDTPTPLVDISTYDILTILDSPNLADNKDYVIESVTLNLSGDLESVVVFDGPKYPNDVGTNARITKSIYSSFNENGLNTVARPRFLRSNTPDIQVANPNAATIISSGIRASNVRSGQTDTLAIEVDGEKHEINLFNSSFETQTLDMIVERFNTYSVSQNLNAYAYKVRSLKCYELAITHVLPNFSDDIKNRTLKIVEASSNDAYESLGLGYILNREVEGRSENVCHINGKLISDFGRILKYSSQSLAMVSGTTKINSFGTNFIEDGVRKGDLCIIEGSSISAENGTYRISLVNKDSITLDSVGTTFSGELDESSAVFIQRCSAPVGELEFEAIDGTIIIDVFMSDEGDINYKRRADVVGHIQDAGFYAIVTDLSKGFIVDDKEMTLEVNTLGYAKLIDQPSLDEGEPVYVGVTGRYKIMSPDKYNFVILDVLSSGLPSSTDSIKITGKSEVSEEFLHLSRITYSSEFGFILGSPSETGGSIPVVVDKRSTGTVDDTIIGENILERYIQGPRNELRGSGIIRDLKFKSLSDNGDGTCFISIDPGVAVVNGVRIEYFGINNLLHNYSTSPHNFYVALDGKGCLLVGTEDITDGVAKSPFWNQNVAHIAYVEITTIIDPVTGDLSIDPTETIITDLRLFVDHLDYKVVADITVSNDQRFGHFTSIEDAVDYSRHFSKIFPECGRPSITVKEGEYKVRETIFLDFDVTITGVGPQTIITRDLDTLDGEAVSGGRLSIVFVIGSGTLAQEASSNDIKYGVTLKDFTYTTPETMSDYGVAISLHQSIDTSPRAKFSFENISFINLDPEDSALGRHEMAISIGPYFEDNVKCGNVFINNCFFDYMGFMFGPAIILEGQNNLNTAEGVVVQGCIAKNVNGDYGAPTYNGAGIVYMSTAASASTTGFIESGCYSDAQ